MRTALIITLAVILTACSNTTTPGEPEKPFPQFTIAEGGTARYQDLLGVTYSAIFGAPEAVVFNVGNANISTQMFTLYVHNDATGYIDSSVILARTAEGMTYEVSHTPDGPKIFAFMTTPLTQSTGATVNPTTIPGTISINGATHRAWLIIEPPPRSVGRLYVDGIGLYQVGVVSGNEFTPTVTRLN